MPQRKKIQNNKEKSMYTVRVEQKKRKIRTKKKRERRRKMMEMKKQTKMTKRKKTILKRMKGTIKNMITEMKKRRLQKQGEDNEDGDNVEQEEEKVRKKE